MRKLNKCTVTAGQDRQLSTLTACYLCDQSKAEKLTNLKVLKGGLDDDACTVGWVNFQNLKLQCVVVAKCQEKTNPTMFFS